MKKFNILMILVLLLSACTSRVDDVFEKSSAVRITEEINRTQKTLIGAANGWVMEFYAATRYGGYNMICKFDENSMATVQNEIYDGVIATSHYKLEQSQGVVLSFDEYNEVMHFFSDPSNPAGIGMNGDGMEGDFEFRVISVSDEEIVLQGKKHGSKVVMHPLALDEDWTDYLDAAMEMEDNMNASNYTFHIGDKELALSSSYRTLNYIDEETGKTTVYPFIFTPKGITFYNDFEYNGKAVKDLIYSEEDGNCYAEDKSIYLEIKPVPLSTLLTSAEWFISKDGMSESNIAKFIACKEGSATEKENLSYIWLGVGRDDKWGLNIQSGQYVGTFFHTPVIVDDNTVTMQYTGYDSGNAAYYVENCGWDAVINLFGGQTFGLTTDNPKNPSWIKMQSKTVADNYLTVYAAEISLPFGRYNE